jgi:hypothetical protein
MGTMHGQVARRLSPSHLPPLFAPQHSISLASHARHIHALVTPTEVAMDDVKEAARMMMILLLFLQKQNLIIHDRDTLEDILYRRLQDLWALQAPLTDSIKVFNANGAAQPLCAQKVWEALLTAFPLDHKRMQTALLARELSRMMHWDGDSKRAVNLHFVSVT